MTNIIINEKKRTIEMSKKDYASACKFGSEEYVDLQEVRRAYPDYRVIAVKSKVSGANVYKGLTYSFMEKYIMNHDDEEKTAMKEYLDMKDKAEEFGAGSDAYQNIREWFIEKYPEIEEYHKEMEQKKKERKEKREEEMEAKRKEHRNKLLGNVA